MKRGAWQKLFLVVLFGSIPFSNSLFSAQPQQVVHEQQIPDHGANQFQAVGGHQNQAWYPTVKMDQRMENFIRWKEAIKSLREMHNEINTEIIAHNNENDEEGRVLRKRVTIVSNELTRLSMKNFATDLMDRVQDSALDAAGKVIEKHVETTLDRTLGSAWDAAVARLVSLLNNLWLLVCCDNHRPFTDRVVGGWQDLVEGAFYDIKTMLSDDLRERSRACDITMRQGDDQSAASSVKPINVWKDLIGSYAQQFDYLVSRIDKHKAFYDENEDSLIIFYAEQIKQQLLKCRNLLMSANSLRELDSCLDSNKAMIEAMRNSLKTLFTLLREQINVDRNDDGQRKPITNSARQKERQYSGFGSLGSNRDSD